MPYNRNTMNLGSSQQRATASVNSFGTAGPQALDVPQGTKYFALKKEMAGQDVYLNIIPWGIETDKHMGVAAGTAKIGDGEFMLELWTHRIEGITNGNAICMQRMYGRKCPTCDAEKMAMESEGKPESKPSHRSAFWVQQVDVHGNPLGGDATPKLFVTSYATFTKALLEAADISGKRLGLNGPVPFADPGENGRTITFHVGTKSMGNGIQFCEATNFEFLPRKNPIPDAILATIPGLDKFIHIPTEKEITDALYGVGENPNAEPADPTGPAQGPEDFGGEAPAYPEPSF